MQTSYERECENKKFPRDEESNTYLMAGVEAVLQLGAKYPEDQNFILLKSLIFSLIETHDDCVNVSAEVNSLWRDLNSAGFSFDILLGEINEE